VDVFRKGKHAGFTALCAHDDHRKLAREIHQRSTTQRRPRKIAPACSRSVSSVIFICPGHRDRSRPTSPHRPADARDRCRHIAVERSAQAAWENLFCPSQCFSRWRFWQMCQHVRRRMQPRRGRDRAQRFDGMFSNSQVTTVQSRAKARSAARLS